jgi:hypothetical protein
MGLRRVRLLYQCGRVVAVDRKYRHPHVEGQHNLLVADSERGFHGFQQPVDGFPGIWIRAHRRQQKQKPVATETRHGVTRPQAFGEPGRRQAQHLVASGNSEFLVDLLEAPQTQHCHGHGHGLPVAGRYGQDLADAFDEKLPVGKPGQQVVVAEILDPGFSFLLIGYIQVDAVPHYVAVSPAAGR